MKMSKENLLNHFSSSVEQIEAAQMEWAKEFVANPLHSMEWADSVFALAARKDVYMKVIDYLNGDVTSEAIKGYLIKSMTYMAKYPKNSSSQCANMSYQAVLTETAKVLEYFETLK